MTFYFSSFRKFIKKKHIQKSTDITECNATNSRRTVLYINALYPRARWYFQRLFFFIAFPKNYCFLNFSYSNDTVVHSCPFRQYRKNVTYVTKIYRRSLDPPVNYAHNMSLTKKKKKPSSKEMYI